MQVDENITEIARALNLKSWDQVSGVLNAFLWVPSILGQRAHLAWAALQSATRHENPASSQSDFRFTDVVRRIPVVAEPHVNVEAASADVAPDDAWPKNTTCVATEQPCSRQKEAAAGNDQSYVGAGAESSPDATHVHPTNSDRIDVPHHPTLTSETTTFELLTDNSAPESATRYSHQQQGLGLQPPMSPLQSTFEATDPNNRPPTLIRRFFDDTSVLGGPATLEVRNAAPYLDTTTLLMLHEAQNAPVLSNNYPLWEMHWDSLHPYTGPALDMPRCQDDGVTHHEVASSQSNPFDSGQGQMFSGGTGVNEIIPPEPTMSPVILDDIQHVRAPTEIVAGPGGETG